MDEMQRAAFIIAQAAFIIAQAAVLHARVAGMQAENMQRAAVGSSMAYSEDAFAAVEREFPMLSHNGALSYLRGD